MKRIIKTLNDFGVPMNYHYNNIDNVFDEFSRQLNSIGNTSINFKVIIVSLGYDYTVITATVGSKAVSIYLFNKRKYSKGSIKSALIEKYEELL